MKLGHYIRNISREAVVDGVKNIKKYHIGSDKIISDRNPLITNGPKAVIKHADRNKNFTIPQRQINSFLAASSLSHMLDGWSYLSHAFNAVLSGDESAATHLSYYAELRSAMSILATEGLGVFNTQHLGVFSLTSSTEFPTNRYQNNGRRINERKPTHQFTWDAMEKWAKSPSKPSCELLKIFKVSGKSFYDLTEFFHPTTATSTLHSNSIIKTWLKEWCLDIKLYRNDRENRNDASYRPQRINNFDTTLDFKSMFNDLDKYWSVISPSNTDKFSLLDKYLLRKLYSSLYSQLTTAVPKEELIRNAFYEHGLSDETLFDFMNFKAPFSSDHIVFTNANIKNTNTLSIFARATLLLRISIGLVSQLFNDGGMNKNELNFIWQNYGIENGFWNSTQNMSSDFLNLWSDIQPSFSDLVSDINTLGNNNDLYSIKKRNPEATLYFGQINRACLWGLDF